MLGILQVPICKGGGRGHVVGLKRGFEEWNVYEYSSNRASFSSNIGRKSAGIREDHRDEGV